MSRGAFGENFTIDSFSEDSIHVGDRFSVGTAEVIVTQPRMPCYKLGIRFQANDLVKKFLVSRRTGLYLAVTREALFQILNISGVNRKIVKVVERWRATEATDFEDRRIAPANHALTKRLKKDLSGNL